jgi:hypothetical protein
MPLFALRLLGWGKVLGGWIAAVLKWLFSKWYRPVIAGLVIALAWVLLVTVPGVKGERDAERQGRLDAVAAHNQTIANYREASAAAMAAAQRHKARVEAQWRDQLEESQRENIALRADYRSRVSGFVRRQSGTAAADPGSTDAAGVPGAAPLPAGLVPPPGTAIVPVRDLELAADAFAQLAALISWAEAVGASGQPPEQQRATEGE